MPLVVENGSGVANANSLVSLEEANEYFETRMNDAWLDYDDKEREAALINASFSLFRFGFRGVPTYATQKLPFPRKGLYDNDGLQYYDDEIPDRVKHAVIELSIRAARGELMVDVPANQRVKSRDESVGPVIDKVEYFDDGQTQATVQSAEMLLSTFLHEQSAARHFVSVPFVVRLG